MPAVRGQSVRYGFDLTVQLSKPLWAGPALTPEMPGEVARVVEAERHRDVCDRRVVTREEESCALAAPPHDVRRGRETERAMEQAR